MKTATQKTARQWAKMLNAHHARTSAGFYDCHGGRYFGARVRRDKLEAWDFDNWTPVAPGTMFHDHNGRTLGTYEDAT